MNPRFPPRNTPAYFTYLEEWLLKERVDNERQWRLLRELESNTTGLDPILSIVSIGLGKSTGSGSGSGSGNGSGNGSGVSFQSGCGCSRLSVVVTLSGMAAPYAIYNGAHTISFVSPCTFYNSSLNMGVSYSVVSGVLTWTINWGPGPCIVSWQGNGNCSVSFGALTFVTNACGIGGTPTAVISS